MFLMNYKKMFLKKIITVKNLRIMNICFKIVIINDLKYDHLKIRNFPNYWLEYSG